MTDGSKVSENVSVDPAARASLDTSRPVTTIVANETD